MEIVKNLTTEKCFIYINEINGGEVLLVTPNANIKSLKLELFSDVEDQPESHLLKEEKVTVAQMLRFYRYNNMQFDEMIENLKDYFDGLPPSEKDLFIKRFQKEFSKNS